MDSTHALLRIAAGIFNLSLGLIVLMSRPKESSHRAYFFWTLVTGVWVINYGLFSICETEAQAFQFSRFAYLLGVPFISPAFFLFSVAWLKRGSMKLALIGVALAVPLAFFMAWAPERIFHFGYFWWGRYWLYNTTPLALTYEAFSFAHFLTFAFLAIHNFYRGWRDAGSVPERIQARNIFIGYLIAYIGVIDFVTAYGVPIYPPAYLTLTILTSIMAYSIIRHRTFDINVFVRRAPLLGIIYASVSAAALPFVIPALRRLLSSLAPEQMRALLLLLVFTVLIVGVGPWILALLIRRSFWLKSKFTMGLTHELKSPVSAILGSSEILLNEAQAGRLDRKKLSDYAAIIHKNAERLDLFVKDLLDIAKIQR